jgi:peptide/nickel transport system substrate-binding protein
LSLNGRDRVVVTALVVIMVALGGLLAIPRGAPVAQTQPEPSAEATPAPPITYREAVVGVPESITPLSARSRSERTLVGLIFSGLVRLGANDTLVPDLASSWSVDDDGHTWTFRIRDDARWQDGVPVTADDVVFTVDALKDPDADGAASASWADVTATAIDERTVTLSLGTPVSGFVAAATQPLLPAHLLAGIPFADLASSDYARSPVGTGPFVLAGIDVRHAVLVPASAGAGPAPADEGDGSPGPSMDSLATPLPSMPLGQAVPYLEQIELDFYPDDAAAADALRAGTVDAVAGLAPDALATLDGLPGVDQVLYPTTTLSTVLLSLRPDHPELGDVRVRQALLGAIDRQALIADVLGGDASPADTLVPPDSWAYDAPSVTPVAFDRKHAGKLLTDAGWKLVNGAWRAPGAKKAYAIELLSVPPDANARLAAVAAYVRDAWTALGIEVHLVDLAASDLAARLRDGAFTASILDINLGIEPDLYPLLASTQVRASGSNLSGYQDPSLDTLLEGARKPGTTEQRTAAWKKLLAGLSTRLPMLPLAWEDEVVVERGLEGVTPRLITGPGDRFWDVLAWRLAADR